MKQKLLILIFTVFSTVTLSAQCPPGGYTVNSQQAADDFAIQYPDCTELNGLLFVTNEINNLDGFINLTSIGGDLILGSTSNNFDISGLSNVTNVSGSLIVQGTNGLTDLDALNSLQNISGSLRLLENSLLSTIDGLANLIAVSGEVNIQGNTLLQDLDGLQGINTVNVDLIINSNESLTSITGLSGVQSIGGYFNLSANPLIINLSGLQSLQSVGDYVFIGDNGLTSLDGLENLQSIGDYLVIQGNLFLQSIQALNHPISIGSAINFTNNSQLSDCAVQAVCELIAEDISLVSTSGNAPGCNSVQQVEQQCNCAGESLDYTTSITTCGSYTIENTAYTESGTYSIPYSNSAGCSGTITLNLTLNPLIVEMQVDGNVLTAVGNFNNIVWLDCNNNFEAIEGASFPVFTATQSGSYAFEADQGTCILQSECETVVITSVDEELHNVISAFPNPVKDILRISNTSNLSISNLRFYSISGKLINDISTLGQSEINVDLSDYFPGIYILEIISDSATQNLKIVKQ